MIQKMHIACESKKHEIGWCWKSLKRELKFISEGKIPSESRDSLTPKGKPFFLFFLFFSIFSFRKRRIPYEAEKHEIGWCWNSFCLPCNV